MNKGTEQPKFERVRVGNGSGKPFTVILEVTNETPTFLTGTECTPEGDVKWTKGGTTETVHMIQKETITKRTPLQMNNTYGWLEEEGSA